VFEMVGAPRPPHGRTNGAAVKNRYGALLKGLLHCSCCNCSMGHSYTGKGSKRYRYYICLSAQKKGWHTCPTKSVPAGEMERFVAEQIQRVGREPKVLEATIRRMREQSDTAIAGQEAELKTLERELVRHAAAVKKLVGMEQTDSTADQMLALQERVEATQRKVTSAREQLLKLRSEVVDPAEVAAALASFTPVWAQLSPREQARVITLLVERVDYDGEKGSVSITFRPGGIKALANENNQQEAA
jgi:site-specific DNA recombinase